MRGSFGQPGLVGVAMLGVVHAAVFMGAIGGAQILLPLIVTEIAPTNRELSFGYVVGIAAVFGAMGGPLIGAFSDRTTLRFGRRRTWMFVSSVVSAGALAALPAAESVFALVVLWSVFGFAISGLFAAVRAFIPDQVPEERRGLASGIFNLGLPLGSLFGTILVSVLVPDTTAAFLTLAVVNFVCVCLFLILTRDPPISGRDLPPARAGAFVRGFWVSPREHPDFALVWATRVLVLLGWQMGFSYMLFFLEDAVGYEEIFPGSTASQGVATLTAVAISALFVASFVSGWLSDRTGRRIPFVVLSGLLMGISLLALAFARDWPALVALAALLGFSIGVFIAVELALITELLPSAGDRGKDLGLVGLADSIPNSVGPLVAGLIVAWAGYPQMFAFAAAATIVGAVLVSRVRDKK